MKKLIKVLIISFVAAMILINLTACESGKQEQRNDDYLFGVYQGDVIPNKEIAENVASAIYFGIIKNNDLRQGKAMKVTFNENNNEWTVYFGIGENNGKYAIGNGCSITINKHSGQVIQIKFEE